MSLINSPRDFIGNFDVKIDLNNAMFRIQNPERKYVIKQVNFIMANENKKPVFLSRRVRLKANEAAVASLRMKNYNELSDNMHSPKSKLSKCCSFRKILLDNQVRPPRQCLVEYS